MVPSPKQPDASFYRKSKMAAVKTLAAITFERLEITRDTNCHPHFFDPVWLGYMTLSTLSDISRRWPTTEFKLAATETGSRNN